MPIIEAAGSLSVIQVLTLSLNSSTTRFTYLMNASTVFGFSQPCSELLVPGVRHHVDGAGSAHGQRHRRRGQHPQRKGQVVQRDDGLEAAGDGRIDDLPVVVERSRENLVGRGRTWLHSIENRYAFMPSATILSRS